MPYKITNPKNGAPLYAVNVYGKLYSLDIGETKTFSDEVHKDLTHRYGFLKSVSVNDDESEEGETISKNEELSANSIDNLLKEKGIGVATITKLKAIGMTTLKDFENPLDFTDQIRTNFRVQDIAKLFSPEVSQIIFKA